jgi:transcriptional regulator GlxA family with amidase domain
VPLHEIANYLPILDVLTNQPLIDLYDKIQSAPSLEIQIAHIENWLLKTLRDFQAQPPIIPASLQHIQQMNGQVSMKKLADDLYISQRQLERLYKTQVGMSPVQYARLIRVQEARNLLKIDTRSTAEIGAELGFYDQSHFIRDFKAIVGITPNLYRQFSQQNQKSESK